MRGARLAPPLHKSAAGGRAAVSALGREEKRFEELEYVHPQKYT